MPDTYVIPSRCMGCRHGAGISSCRSRRTRYCARQLGDVRVHRRILPYIFLTTASRDVPPNCRFECGDANDGLSRYKNSFDVIHFRSVTTGILDCQEFFYELYDLLRPGGVLLVIEGNSMHFEDCPMVIRVQNVAPFGMGEWNEEFEKCCSQPDEESTPVRFSLGLRATFGLRAVKQGFSYMVMLVRMILKIIIVSQFPSWEQWYCLTRRLGSRRNRGARSGK